jgi:hypothetical protein
MRILNRRASSHPLRGNIDMKTSPAEGLSN